MLNTEFASIYDAYYHDVYLYLVTLTNGRRDLAEELTQETFFQVFLSLHRFKGESSIKTYIVSIARNTCKNYYKKNPIMSGSEDMEWMLNDETQSTVSIEEYLLKVEQREELRKVILGLDPKYRDIVIYRIYHELSFQKISQFMKVDTISMIAIVALWVVFMYCFQVVEVSGISMQPTFQDGDKLLMNRVIYHITEPKRGDVVMVNLEDMSILKRVVAVPGETIDIKDHAIFIDGKQIEIEEEEGTILPGELTYPITLGEDEYFVMGDNVEVSLDSRSSEVGVVERDEIRTKYACRFFKFK